MNSEAPPRTSTVTLTVEGMNCGSCVRHIGEALEANLTLIDQAVDLVGKKVTVTFDSQATSLTAIVKVLDEAGYPAQLLES